MNNKNTFLLILTIALASCSLFEKKQAAGVVAELKGHQLTRIELDQITSAADKADSAAIAEQYIRQWAEDILLYDEAKDRPSAEVEKLVEDYRRSLYIHEYEQRLVARYRPHHWQDSVVRTVYANNKNRLRLHQTIVKGVLVIVPQKTPKQEKVKKWLSTLTEDNIDKIDKYALQYATGYEFFADEWRSANQILMQIPTETDILNQHIAKRNQIIVEDSASVYILQLTDKRMSGDIMPMDYAKEQIEQILLNRWQVDFMKQKKANLYNEAVRFNKLKRYEN